MPDHRILHQTAPMEPPPSEGYVARYQRELAEFRVRKRWALVVAVVCHVAAVAMIALGVALLLGSQNTIAGHWLAQRHPPGQTGTITLDEDGRYAITRTRAPAPVCNVTTIDGEQVALVQESVPRSNAQVPAFDAVKGRYVVQCEGGNDGVVVFAMEDMDVVANGWLAMALRALPFIALGLIFYAAGRYLPRRIAPERLRPMIPS